MQRSWRGKDKPRKKSKSWKNKGQDWNSESENAFYKKVERQKQQKLHEQMDEMEQFDDLAQLDESTGSDDWDESDEEDNLEEAEWGR